MSDDTSFMSIYYERFEMDNQNLEEHNVKPDFSAVDLSEFGIFDIDKINVFINELKEKKRSLESEKAEYEIKEAERKQEEAKRVAERKHKEHIISVTSMELPLDWNNVFDDSDLTDDVYVESISDGYIKCLNNLGRVDIEYIASITGTDCKTVINELKGSIYQNPETWGECFYKGWETSEEYLSGNIRHKLEIAKEQNKEYLGYFKDNVEALSRIRPDKLSAEDIYITLGSPWIPTEYIKKFCAYISNTVSKEWTIEHDPITASWEVKYSKYKRKSYGYFGRREEKVPNYVALSQLERVYSAPDIKAIDIIRKTLNMKSLAVYRTDENGNKYVNDDNTIVAYEKQKLLINAFRNWAWGDIKRKKELIDIYDEKYGSIVARQFNGDFLEFPQMNKDIFLYKYQKDAIFRIIMSDNTLLAHDVGAGKTYIMIAAGMELKRMGLSDNNMYVVPNNIIGQWKEAFSTLYPDSNVLCISPKEFTPSKRKMVIRQIMDYDYDAVIIAYSCFTQIPISPQIKNDMLRAELDKFDEDKVNTLTKRRCAAKTKLSDQIRNLELEARISKDIYTFDNMGITRLFIDEAHNFKNVPIDTKIEKVMGISKAGSVKCKDMMEKVRIVQYQNYGKGVVMATGTPITNSISDAYIMQKYLQNGELKILGLEHFDSWVANFAETVTSFEIDVDTSTYRMATRFSEFHNIPELTNILAGIADFHRMDDRDDIPHHDGYNDVLVRKTKDFSDYLLGISHRADQVRTGKVKRTEDNMLKITTDGRKAALDIRLISSTYPFTVASKVFQCADRVSMIYKDTLVNKSTQLVFCDTSIPKNTFNIYDELRDLLVKMGVDDNEIAYIHDANSEEQKQKLFSDVQEGKIRVLIGSTFKLGLGVNVQNKLIALHHLDVPWRPADMVQREGRILRQGNENKEVRIYRYITEGSFDAYSWQLLETKQRFISSILSGAESSRSGKDVDETVLDYAEVKALAVGNSLLKEKVTLTNELSRYLILQEKEYQHKQGLRKELDRLDKRSDFLKEDLPALKSDMLKYVNYDGKYSKKDREEIRKVIYKSIKESQDKDEDINLLEYYGFQIVIPKKSTAYNPVIFLVGNKRYIIKLGEGASGNLIRIDNKLRAIETEYYKKTEELNNIKSSKKTIQDELSKEADYEEKIAECKAKIKEIDSKLGI